MASFPNQRFDPALDRRPLELGQTLPLLSHESGNLPRESAPDSFDHKKSEPSLNPSFITMQSPSLLQYLTTNANNRGVGQSPCSRLPQPASPSRASRLSKRDRNRREIKTSDKSPGLSSFFRDLRAAVPRRVLDQSPYETSGIHHITMPLGRPTGPITMTTPTPIPASVGAHANRFTPTLRQQQPFINLSTPNLLTSPNSFSVSGDLGRTNLCFPESSTTASPLPTSSSVPYNLIAPADERSLKPAASHGDLRMPSHSNPIRMEQSLPQQSETLPKASQRLPKNHRWRTRNICDDFFSLRPRLVAMSPPDSFSLAAQDEDVLVISKGQTGPRVVHSVDSQHATEPVARLGKSRRTGQSLKRGRSLGSHTLLNSATQTTSAPGRSASDASTFMTTKSAPQAGTCDRIRDAQLLDSPPLSTSFGFLYPLSLTRSRSRSQAHSRQGSAATQNSELVSNPSTGVKAGGNGHTRTLSACQKEYRTVRETSHSYPLTYKSIRGIRPAASSPDLRQIYREPSLTSVPTSFSPSRTFMYPRQGPAQNITDENVLLIGSGSSRQQYSSHSRQLFVDKPLPPIPFAADRPPKLRRITPTGDFLHSTLSSKVINPTKSKEDPLKVAYQCQTTQAALRPRHAPPPPPPANQVSPGRVQAWDQSHTPPRTMKRGNRNPPPEPLPLSTVLALVKRAEASPTRKKASIEEAIDRARTTAVVLNAVKGNSHSLGHGHIRQPSAAGSIGVTSNESHASILAAAGLISDGSPDSPAMDLQQRSKLQPTNRYSILSRPSRKLVPPTVFSDSKETSKWPPCSPVSSRQDGKPVSAPPFRPIRDNHLSPLSSDAISPQPSTLTQASFDDITVLEKDLFYASPTRPTAAPMLLPLDLPEPSIFQRTPSISLNDLPGLVSGEEFKPDLEDFSLSQNPVKSAPDEVASPVEQFLSGEKSESPLTALMHSEETQTATPRAICQFKQVLPGYERAEAGHTVSLSPTEQQNSRSLNGLFGSPATLFSPSEDHDSALGFQMDSSHEGVSHKSSSDTIFRIRTVSRKHARPTMDSSPDHLPEEQYVTPDFRSSAGSELIAGIQQSPADSSLASPPSDSPLSSHRRSRLFGLAPPHRLSSQYFIPSSPTSTRDSGTFSFMDAFPVPPESTIRSPPRPVLDSVDPRMRSPPTIRRSNYDEKEMETVEESDLHGNTSDASGWFNKPTAISRADTGLSTMTGERDKTVLEQWGV